MIKRLFWDDISLFVQVADAFKRGQVIIGDSDTVVGLYAPLTLQGFTTLNDLKGRFEKPYLILVSSQQQALSFIEQPLSPSLSAIITSCWPGPLTLVCKARLDLPDYVKSSSDTIALRVPDHKGLHAILSRYEGLFSTSANKAGLPVPDSLNNVDPDILAHVSYAILNRKSMGDQTGDNTVASTILDCTSDSITVIRSGVYPLSCIEQQAGISIIKK